jgi:hypothetical protein
MKTDTLPFARIVAILALTAASTSAFAQSTEYRRGYADGYVAGQQSVRNERGRDHGWNRVYIEDAEYGTHEASCDARRAVRQEIERNNGNVRAGNQLCGDPAHNQVKRLRIVYRCGDSEALRVIARENETVRLVCRREGQ